MSDVFISYRRLPSASLAMLIQEKLKNQHDIDAYVDVTRVDGASVPFEARLYNAIDEAPVFMCLLGQRDGKHTLESDWVLKEIVRAHEGGKFCIPVFQESYAPIEHSNVAISYLLAYDGVPILDIRNVYIDKAIADIAALISKTTPVIAETTPLPHITPNVLRKRVFIVGVVLIVFVALFLTLQTINLGTTDLPTATETAANAFTQAAQSAQQTITLEAQGSADAQMVALVQAAQTELRLTLTAYAQQTFDAYTDTPPATFTSTSTSTFTPTSSYTPTPTVNLTETAQVSASETADTLGTAEQLTAQAATQIAQLTDAAPTNTPRPTATPTFTHTATATATITPTFTASATLTFTPNFTETAGAIAALTTTQESINIANETQVYLTAVATANMRATESLKTSVAEVTIIPTDGLAVTPVAEIITIVNVDSANIRVAPSEEHDVIGFSSRGGQLRLIGRTNDGWYKLDINNSEITTRSDIPIGWVFGTSVELPSQVLLPLETMIPPAPRANEAPLFTIGQSVTLRNDSARARDRFPTVLERASTYWKDDLVSIKIIDGPRTGLICASCYPPEYGLWWQVEIKFDYGYGGGVNTDYVWIWQNNLMAN